MFYIFRPFTDVQCMVNYKLGYELWKPSELQPFLFGFHKRLPLLDFALSPHFHLSPLSVELRYEWIKDATPLIAELATGSSQQWLRDQGGFSAS